MGWDRDSQTSCGEDRSTAGWKKKHPVRYWEEPWYDHLYR